MCSHRPAGVLSSPVVRRGQIADTGRCMASACVSRIYERNRGRACVCVSAVKVILQWIFGGDKGTCRLSCSHRSGGEGRLGQDYRIRWSVRPRSRQRYVRLTNDDASISLSSRSSESTVQRVDKPCRLSCLAGICFFYIRVCASSRFFSFSSSPSSILSYLHV